MAQQQEPLRPPASSASLGGFLQACSWGWGIIALILGVIALSATPLYGAVAILLGVLLLPPIRKMIGGIIGVRLAGPVAIILAMLITGTIMVIGRDIAAEQMVKKRKQAAAEKESARQENALIASYPYVDRDSLRSWRKSAADSTTDPDLTLASFLRRQEELHGKHLTDSIASAREHRADSMTSARQHREDSIIRAKQWRRDSIASARSHISDSIATARMAQRASVEQQRPIRQSESAPEYYNGHQIFIGPRGGRYYINDNGNKTYIR